MMKQVKLGATIIVLFTLAFLGLGSMMQQAPNFSYVYSNSMEPAINTGDGFIVLPSSQFAVNDIIVFRPVLLDAELITHRIIEITPDGFITQGDNSPNIDQEIGEPIVAIDRIVGKVWTISDNPVVIPNIGNILLAIQSFFGNATALISSFLTFVAVILLLRDIFASKHKPKSKKRWRMKDVYQWLTIGMTAVLIIAILAGSNFFQLRYLVSQNPGTIGLQVRPNQTGSTQYQLSNSSIIPVYSFVRAIDPLIIDQTVTTIGSLSNETIDIMIQPQPNLGWYTGYIQVINIPALLPKVIVERFYLIHPLMAILVIALATYGWLLLLIKIFELVFQVSGWVPVSALKDKISKRRIEALLNQAFGRRRIR